MQTAGKCSETGVNFIKIIIFSDSHGNSANMKKVIENTLPTTELYIHCGDGIEEFNALRTSYPERGFVCVRGNSDYFVAGEVFDTVLDLDGYRTLITHGHRYVDLLNLAKARDCKVVLSGHTHERSYEYTDGVYLFNPGSISRPRDGKAPSYGVMEIRNGILFSHGEIELFTKI